MVTRQTHTATPAGLRPDAGRARGLGVAIVSEPGCDGVFRYVEGLADYLIKQGVHVHLAYSDRRACSDLPRLVQRVKDSGGTTLNLRVGNAPEARDVVAVAALARFVRQSGAQVVHANSSKAGALARALRAMGVGVPVIYSPHAYYGLNPKGPVKAAFYNRIEWALKPLGFTITTSSSESRFAIEKLGVSPSRQLLIPNGVDVERFRPATPEERQEARRELGLPQDAIIVGSIARVSVQKDPLTLYRAFSRVARGRKDLLLYHLGGKGSEEMERDLKSVVSSHNLQDQVRREHFRSDTSLVYRALDALALTSRYEGMSLVLLEAMASGLPLILSDAPGNRDVKGEGLNRVWWSRVGSVPEFAEAIEDCARTARAGCNHREVAVARFSQEACFGAVLACYQKAFSSIKRPIRLLPSPNKATPRTAA